MKGIQDEIWAKPTIDTKYGKIPSTNIGVNGEQIQALARSYTMAAAGPRTRKIGSSPST